MTDAAETFRDARSRFIDLIRSLPDEQLDLWVPACPQWSIREIVAHLAGVSADFIARNFPASGTPFECWTAIQVANRAGRSVDELLAEWDELAPEIVAMIADGRASEGPLISDVVTHEQDVRGALGVPGGRDAPGYAFARDRFLLRLGARIREAGQAALRLHTDCWDHTAGDGEPATSVSAPTYELERALAGRRSRNQIERFDWNGDGAMYQRLIPMMGPSKFDLIETA
jgi:uncharacterized protein (TIGR03083 family)